MGYSNYGSGLPSVGLPDTAPGAPVNWDAMSSGGPSAVSQIARAPDRKKLPISAGPPADTKRPPDKTAKKAPTKLIVIGLATILLVAYLAYTRLPETTG